MSRLAAVILTAIVSVIVTSAFWVVGLVVAYGVMSSDVALLDLEVDAPASVPQGEVFSMVLRVSNPTDEDIEFGSIDIYEELLDGFDVQSVTPAPVSTDTIMGFTSWYYSDVLTPGEQREIRFEMKGKTTGTWSGDVDCCTVEEDFVTEIPTIRVTAPTIEAESD